MRRVVEVKKTREKTNIQMRKCLQLRERVLMKVSKIEVTLR